MTPDIFESSYRLLNKYNQKTQKPKHYGTDDLLYAAEVHMIDTIGTHGEITTTFLAQLLGIGFNFNLFGTGESGFIGIQKNLPCRA